MSDFPAARWCRSRRAGAVCTRPTGHSGLHNRVGTALMWSQAQADPPACEGAGMPVLEARRLADEFPHGRGLCRRCWGFVDLADDGTLARHEAFRAAQDAADAAHRAEWFNTFGWQS